MKYIVKIPSLGGWNKAHIWKVGEPLTGQSLIVTLCNRGARHSPQGAWIPTSWLENYHPAIPLTTQNPLEGKNECESCLRKWLLEIWEKP